MIGYEAEVIKKYVLEAGLWKFYLLGLGLLAVFIMNVIEGKKEKLTKIESKLRQIAIVSSGVLFLITIAFIIIARI